MTKNIVLIVEYDGTNFYGWQKQEGLRTVEMELKKALDKATGEDINLVSSGRTDRFVHSKGQVVNFKTGRSNIPGENYKLLLDYLLPKDISIKDSFEVHNKFHSRYDAIMRRYSYLVYNRKLPNALFRNHSYHCPYELDLEKMRNSAREIVGTHDFTSFSSTINEDTNPIRRIDRFDIYKEGDFIKFIIEGNAFLHNMVRILVGTILYIGAGKIKSDEITNIFNSKNREKAGITVGGEGLYLEKVFYPENIFKTN